MTYMDNPAPDRRRHRRYQPVARRPVCPDCEKAMTQRDSEGYLACGDCGLRAVER